MAPNGVLYVNTWSGRYYGNDTPHAGGFLVALQDTTGSGKADVNRRFGETVRSGGAGGTGIGFFQGALYAESNDKIVRYALPAGSIVPQGASETVVAGLPLGGDHPMHPFAIDADGLMYIDVATATNSCQHENRTLRSPGARPCTELKTRGGIWRYDATKLNQVFSPQERFATGIRNAEGFAIDAPAHQIFVTQHGRDQLHANWPDLYPPEQEATLPAEELLRLEQGGDYGWPACYYDAGQGALVLAPEYGGDGGKKRGDCTRKIPPIAAFPAHWAPDGMVFYDRPQFPARYRNGVFIAFHGSWDRAPYSQEGYNVVFQPLADGKAAGGCEIFADGFAGEVKSPENAQHRPTGIAVGLDGSLFVSDDVHGRIYRIEYRGGGSAEAGAAGTPCPSATAPPGTVASAEAGPPEGTHPDAGGSAGPSAAELPVPDGATQAQLVLGERIFHGQVGGADLHGMPRGERHRYHARAEFDRYSMAVEQWLVGWHPLDDHAGCDATEEVPSADATDGRCAAHARPGVRGSCLRVGSESSEPVGPEPHASSIALAYVHEALHICHRSTLAAGGLRERLRRGASGTMAGQLRRARRSARAAANAECRPAEPRQRHGDSRTLVRATSAGVAAANRCRARDRRG